MRCLTFLVIAALFAMLGITGYNYLQIKQLSRDMAIVKAKVLTDESGYDSQADVTAALRVAKQHADRAKELIAKGRDAVARIEYEKSLRSLENAAKLSQKVATNAAHKVDTSVSAARKQIEEMWKEASRQNQKGKSEKNDTKSGK